MSISTFKFQYVLFCNNLWFKLSGPDFQHILKSFKGLSTRRVSLCGKHTNDDSTVPLSKVELHGGAADSHLATFKPEVNIDQNILLENQHIKLQINPKNGLLMSIKSNEKPEKSEISFAKYGTRSR